MEAYTPERMDTAVPNENTKTLELGENALEEKNSFLQKKDIVKTYHKSAISSKENTCL